MGGNALKNTVTRRYSKEEYEGLCRFVSGKLTELAHECALDGFDIIPSYRMKDSFGDMDVLYSTSNNKPLSPQLFKDLFLPNEIVQNSNVISLDVEQFQIDLIHAPRDHYNYALNYYKFSDLGNLIGKLARQLGLKHGHNGLYLPLRDGDNKFHEICLTTDHEFALEFLGLDPEKFHKGFDTLDDMFNYVSSSPYFNPDKYKLENVSSAGRVRDKKRKTYQEFLKYCETYSGPVFIAHEDKTKYFELIFDYFETISEPKVEFDARMGELALLKLAKEKFNGDAVSDLTGLCEKELGMFMAYLRTDFNFSKGMAVYQSQESVDKRIIDAFLVWSVNSNSQKLKSLINSSYGRRVGLGGSKCDLLCVHANLISLVEPYLIDSNVFEPSIGEEVFGVQDLTHIGRGKFMNEFYYNDCGFCANLGDTDPYPVRFYVPFTVLDQVDDLFKNFEVL
jgi:hypothetical protein